MEPRPQYRKALESIRQDTGRMGALVNEALARAMATLFVARYLERAGDHVTNIAEWIVYERTVRHVELNP